MANLQTIPGCCCPECRIQDCICAELHADAYNRGCIPECLCLVVTIAGGPTCPCTKTTLRGIACWDGGGWAGSASCGSFAVDARLVPKRLGSQCVLCLSSTCLGITEDCKPFNTYPDPSGTWTDLNFDACLPGCGGGTLSFATPQIIPESVCLCGCHPSQMRGELVWGQPGYDPGIPGGSGGSGGFCLQEVFLVWDPYSNPPCWRYSGMVSCGPCEGKSLALEVCCNAYPGPLEDAYLVRVQIDSCVLNTNPDVVVCNAGGGPSIHLLDLNLCDCQVTLTVDGSLCN